MAAPQGRLWAMPPDCHAQPPMTVYPWPGPADRLEYQRVRFTAAPVGCDDPRFRMTDDCRLVGGARLVSRDRAIYAIAWINGMSSGMLCDGRGFVMLPYFLSREGIREIRVARTIELAGGYPDRYGVINPAPSWQPDIPGYRFVVADSILTGHAVGLWRRMQGPDETLIVAFHAPARDQPGSHTILGRLPLRLKSIYLHGLHIWYINVISEARVGQPIYILEYHLPWDALPYGSRAILTSRSPR
jgi:hypothetical protein